MDSDDEIEAIQGRNLDHEQKPKKRKKNRRPKKKKITGFEGTQLTMFHLAND